MKPGRKESDKDEAFDAVRQAASGAIGVIAEQFDLPPESLASVLQLAVPVIVTTHPLFAASLDVGGEVRVRTIERAEVPVRLPGMDSAILVHIVAEGSLQEFLDICDKTVEALRSFRPVDRSKNQS